MAALLDEVENRAGALNNCEETEDAIVERMRAFVERMRAFVERMRAFGWQTLSGWASGATPRRSPRWAQAVKAAGWSLNTQILALGSGAPSIA